MAIQKWEFDPVHSTVAFSVRNLVVAKVHGRFARWSGTLLVDETNPAASSVEVSIETDSIDTHDAGRDVHLRSADFFDVAKYPSITFRSTGVDAQGDGRFKVTGDLTLHGVTRAVVLDVEYHGQVVAPHVGTRAGFSARTSVNRKDFGITFNQVLDTGGLALSERVDVTLDVEVAVPVAEAASRS